MSTGMRLTGAFASGVDGYRRATRSLAKNADKVQRAAASEVRTPVGADSVALSPAARAAARDIGRSMPSGYAGDSADLVDGLVGQRVDLASARAAVAVLRTADETTREAADLARPDRRRR